MTKWVILLKYPSRGDLTAVFRIPIPLLDHLRSFIYPVLAIFQGSV